RENDWRAKRLPHGQKSRRSREEHAPAQRHFRGTGLEVLRAHRWPRHTHADPHARIPEAPEAAYPAARADHKREGLRAGLAEAEEIPWPRPLRSGNGRNAAVRQADVLRSLCRDA